MNHYIAIDIETLLKNKRNTMMKKISDFFLGHHLENIHDDFEVAKIKLIYNFFLFFTLFVVIFSPFIIFLYGQGIVTYINIFAVTFYLLPLILLKLLKSYTIPAIAFCIILCFNTTLNSIINNGLLSFNICIWYFIAIAFANYTLSKKLSIIFMASIFLTILAILLLRLKVLLYINPLFSAQRDLATTPGVLLVTFPIIYKLMIEQIKTKQEAIENFKATLKAKDRIIGIVAHDLKNPIGTIQGFMYLIRSELGGSISGEIKEYLDTSAQACENAMENIGELVEAAELDQAERKYETELIELKMFLQSMVRAYKAKAIEKKISLSLQSRHEMVHVNINKTKCTRMMDNLLSNAIKFSKENGKINVGLETKPDTAVTSVSDTGIGIPSELHELIFDKFTTAGRPGTKKETSTGLGLSIVKRIVEKHSGNIWFESRENIGTTFNIELPLADRTVH